MLKKTALVLASVFVVFLVTLVVLSLTLKDSNGDEEEDGSTS